MSKLCLIKLVFILFSTVKVFFDCSQNARTLINFGLARSHFHSLPPFYRSVFVLLNLHYLLQLLIRQVLQIFNLRFQICDVIIGLQRADNFLVNPLIQVLGQVGTDQLGQFLDELPLLKKFLTLNDCRISSWYWLEKLGLQTASCLLKHDLTLGLGWDHSSLGLTERKSNKYGEGL